MKDKSTAKFWADVVDEVEVDASEWYEAHAGELDAGELDDAAHEAGYENSLGYDFTHEELAYLFTHPQVGHALLARWQDMLTFEADEMQEDLTSWVSEEDPDAFADMMNKVAQKELWNVWADKVSALRNAA